MSDLKLLQDLNAKGVALALNVPAIGGVQTQSISPEQALGLLTDAEQVYAEVLGLTRTQYVEWHASQGCVYCRATTRAGDRCRNFVIRGTGLEPARWKALCETGATARHTEANPISRA